MPDAAILQTDISSDELVSYAESLGYGELHYKLAVEVGLKAIIAIHSTKLGPALGGCRFIPYATFQESIKDAIRLGRGMSYKAALAGLPYGGGKAVIVCPPHIRDRQALFAAFGRFINDLGGRYITAMDSGTTVNDMDTIATITPYVTCTSKEKSGDPSSCTAYGVYRGIQAAVKFKLHRDLELQVLMKR